MLEIGSVVDGKYKILNKIGQGGMSVVYLAMNEKANKQWAIKEVRKDGVLEQNYEVVKQGLIVETDLLKKLVHPNLPSIVDVIDGEDIFLIVMDYIEGNPLDKILKESGAQEQEYVIEWAKQLCDVLGYLHSRRPPIIYRDMKPANVMLKPDGDVMLIDFGIAREFKETSVEDTTCLGTPGYAAPEQFGGRGQTDPRTDIYCLGATLYHLVTGHNPSEAPYVMYPIRYWNPNLSSGLEIIIKRCTDPNPNNRYQSCTELMYALEHIAEIDENYHRKMTNRLRTFIATSILTVLFASASIVGHAMETKTQQSTYEMRLEEANNPSKRMDERVKLYREAMNLDPQRAEAYTRLLDLYLEDSNYTSQEDAEFTQIMEYVKSGNRKNVDQFKNANPEAYIDFAYEMGKAYFFSYEGKGNKKYSASYFEHVMNNTKDTALQMRSKLYYKIGSFYDGLAVQDQAGDSKYSYREYWNDLMELNRENSDTNEITALRLYIEIAYQIATNGERFQRDGIQENELRQELNQIESRVDKIQPSGNNRQTITQLKTQLSGLTENAYETIDAVFKKIGREEAGILA